MSILNQATATGELAVVAAHLSNASSTEQVFGELPGTVAEQLDLLHRLYRQLADAPDHRIAVAYRCRDRDSDRLIVNLRPSPDPEDLDYQASLTHLLERCEPVYRTIRGSVGAFLEAIQAELGVPIGLTSSGPTFQDKAVVNVGVGVRSTRDPATRSA